jgi:hypothetical protein
MGFDPRDWPSGGRSSRPITGNLDALLEENTALKQEVLRLRRLLDRHERLEREPRAASAKPQWLCQSEAAHWARLLTQQPGWSQLRAGDEAHGLMGLIADLNRSSFLPQLSLEQRLDRLAPGLGRDLDQALHGLNSKQQLALRAAFGVYGISAREWLADEPRRVVAELRQQCQRLEQRSRTRRSGARSRQQQRAHEAPPGPPPGSDPRRAAAYQQLGLAWGASRDAIKQAHRRLVKQHHPDMGGDAAAFRRVNDAYQLLMA